MQTFEAFKKIANVGEKFFYQLGRYEVTENNIDLKYFLKQAQQSSRMEVADITFKDIYPITQSINIPYQDLDELDHSLVIQKAIIDRPTDSRRTGIFCHMVLLVPTIKQGEVVWVVYAYIRARFKRYYLAIEPGQVLGTQLVRSISEKVLSPVPPTVSSDRSEWILH